MPDRYLVAGCTPWAKRIFDKTLSKLPGEWELVETTKALESALPRPMFNYVTPPTYIFFLHWRWKVPAEIVNKYECVGMHLGELPQQRGGSPLQWRILEGQTHATLTAFRMTRLVDVGPQYGFREVALYGAAEAIYAAAMEQAADLIKYIITERPTPNPPLDDWTRFRPLARRKPEDSRIPTTATLINTYDWIRCVDAADYPRAFLEYGGLRFTFYQAVMYDGKIRANVEITEVGE